jgi:hypothetical protein
MKREELLTELAARMAALIDHLPHGRVRAAGPPAPAEIMVALVELDEMIEALPLPAPESCYLLGWRLSARQMAREGRLRAARRHLRHIFRRLRLARYLPAERPGPEPAGLGGGDPYPPR